MLQQFTLSLQKHYKNMIKIGVSIDDNPVKDYLDLMSGENPFLISGFSHSVHSNINTQGSIKKNNSFISLLDNSDAILFLEGTIKEPEKISFALKKFKHVFLTHISEIPQNVLLEFQKLASEANVFIKAANPLLYNPAYISCNQEVRQPKFIEINRKEVPKLKLKEDIIKDLARDLEFIFLMTNNTPKKIFSSGSISLAGIPVFINARIEFDNGTSANISYDFLQTIQEHTATIHLYEQSFFLNFINFNAYRNQLKDGTAPSEQIANQSVTLITDNFVPNDQNPFHLEIKAFYETISGMNDPSTSFDNSLMALKVARSILSNIHIPKSSPV
jgi:hypothetical protein